MRARRAGRERHRLGMPAYVPRRNLRRRGRARLGFRRQAFPVGCWVVGAQRRHGRLAGGYAMSTPDNSTEERLRALCRDRYQLSRVNLFEFAQAAARISADIEREACAREADLEIDCW